MHVRAHARAVSVLFVLSAGACAPPSEPQSVDQTSQTLPSGFTKTRIASGLSLPLGMAFAPDGRLFVIERGTTAGGTGKIRIIKNGQLLSTPFASITVNNASVSANERGLLGIALDPGFNSNHFVYVYYTVNASTPYNRISRFTANGDTAVAGSETLILRLDDLAAGNHNGGALAFGKDGKLYVGVGENHDSTNAIDLTNYLGKVLRLNPDGSAPTDNPFYNAGDGISAKDRIWTYGHRNVWRLAVNPSSGKIFANDVGEATWEEINDVTTKGKDFGWRGGTTDGDSTVWFKYDHNAGKCITGGTFYSPAVAPGGFSAYVGKYFFTDYSNGWLKAIDTSTKSLSTFDTGLSGPTDLAVGPDGNLYLTTTGSGEVWRYSSTTAQQSLLLSDSALSINEGSSKMFTVRLAVQPGGNVSVAVARTSGDATITASPATLTFTTSSWSTPQNVTVAAAQDADSSNETAVITASSSGLTSRTVDVTAIDDDVAGPLTQITAPMNGATVSGRNAEFYGGSNLDGTTSSVKGEFYVDGVLKYTDVGTGHYHYNGSHQLWDTTQLGEGLHALRLTVYDSGNRTGSHDIQVTVDNLPSPWNHQDIGAVGAAGGANASGGVFSVRGAGADIWGTADELHYAYQPMNGDGEIVARVTAVQRTADWSKAGVMMRTSTAANSAYAFMLLSGAGNVSFQRRLTAGGTATATNSTAGTSPFWVRLKRTGNTILASRSSDGGTWIDVGSDTIAFGTSVNVGLAVTGHADPMVAEATFDMVAVGSGGTCTPESNATFCSRMGKNCGTVTGADNCGVSRTVSSCGTCTSPATCGGGGTPNVCGGGGGGGPVYTYLEAESGAGAGTAPMTIVSDAGASGGKAIWSPTVGSNLNPPTDGHVTYPFSVGAAGTWKLWGRFLVGPATSSDDSLWARVDGGSFVQWNNIFARIGNAAYAWDSVHDTANADALVTYNLTAGNHTLEIAYRESGLKMDRFLLTNDLAFNPGGGSMCTPESNATFCSRLGKNCGSVTGTDNCGASRTVSSCGTCTGPQTCGGGGTPNVCGGGSSGSCTFTVTMNVYDGPNWWGTIAFKNNGPSASSAYQVAFDVPSGVQCDFAETGWTVSQSGTRCTYKNPGQTLASGASLTMHYSTNSQGFTSAGNVVVSDSTCGGGGSCTPESNTTFCSRLGKNCGSVTGTDNCGTARSVSSCGTCTSPQTCGGGGTPNVCGGGSCTPESNSAFCSRLGKNCGSVTGTDNCGVSRTVSSCGTCTSPATCGGGGTANVCGTSGGNLVWKKANLTWFTSYPDPNSEECIKFNGCMWAGQFAFVNGTQTKAWVMAHNIAAVHEKDANTYALKTLRLKQGTHQIDVTVYDECADSDCSGCCTQNASQNGLNFLIDIESFTADRFGANDGIVDWACLDCP